MRVASSCLLPSIVLTWNCVCVSTSSTSRSCTATAIVASIQHVISISSAPNLHHSSIAATQHSFQVLPYISLLKTSCTGQNKQVRVLNVPIAEFDSEIPARKLLATTEAFAFGVCGGLLSGLPGASDNALLPCPTNYGCRRNSQNYWQCFPGATAVQPYIAPVLPPPPPPPSPLPESPSPPFPSSPAATPLSSHVANNTITGELVPQLIIWLEHYALPGVLSKSQPISCCKKTMNNCLGPFIYNAHGPAFLLCYHVKSQHGPIPHGQHCFMIQS